MTFYVYHISRPNQPLSEGYIGVTHRLERRWYEHERHTTNPHLSNALKKYDDIRMVAIAQGVESECLQLERQLRPDPEMGWNVAPGGGKPPGRRDYSKQSHVMRSVNKDYWKRPENALRQKERMTGKNSPMYGKPSPNKGKDIQSEEFKLKQSLNKKRQRTCPHCQKTGGEAGMYRWHFNNCKETT